MANKIYLGVSGLVSHPNEVADRYNKLLDNIGYENMLFYMEKMLSTQDFRQIIKEIEDDIELTEDLYSGDE